MATNPDFRDLLSALSAEGADFIVVGAHAVMFHTSPRYTSASTARSAPSALRWPT
jgi:hypothetical protein